MYRPRVTTRSSDAERLLTTLARFNRWATRSAQVEHDIVIARLLSLVDELQPVRISTLAAADHTTQPTMTAHVRRLEDTGLLRREADPSDARASLISLSEAGTRALTDIRTARTAALLPHLDALTDADVATLTAAADVLDRILGRSAASA